VPHLNIVVPDTDPVPSGCERAVRTLGQSAEILNIVVPYIDTEPSGFERTVRTLRQSAKPSTSLYRALIRCDVQDCKEARSMGSEWLMDQWGQSG
jgi:hypothetical protein